MRILLSEGSSTSAREALTAFGLAGHHVEVCDPQPHCLARISRFTKAFHRCPPLGRDPLAFVEFVHRLCRERAIDVLVPIHEQGLALAAYGAPPGGTACALPAFEAYERALDKAQFTALLGALDVAQPPTRLLEGAGALRAETAFPAFVKASHGTASRGVWRVETPEQLETAVAALAGTGAFDAPVLVQEPVPGGIGHVQCVFDKGRMVGVHGYRQILAGAGGGEAVKESDLPYDTRDAAARIGAALEWHGGLSFDYITDTRDGANRFIDCNPRLVEPMSAWFAGTDLAGLLLEVSLGKAPEPQPPAPPGVRTRLAMQGLLGCALRGGSRRALLKELWRMTLRRGHYVRSREELTPLTLDARSALPLAATAISLLAHPRSAGTLVRRGWGPHLLTHAAVRAIREMAGEKTR